MDPRACTRKGTSPPVARKGVLERATLTSAKRASYTVEMAESTRENVENIRDADRHSANYDISDRRVGGGAALLARVLFDDRNIG